MTTIFSHYSTTFLSPTSSTSPWKRPTLAHPKNNIFMFQKKKNNIFKVSCKSPNTKENPTTRRGIIFIGLGGIYGAATLNKNPLALAKPTYRTVANPTPMTTFPFVLEKVVRAKVARPRKSRSKKEKEEEEEVLVIEGIEFDRDVPVKFDVHVNDMDDTTMAYSRPDKSEFAGSFVNVPRKHKHGNKMNTTLRLGLTDLLEDLGAEGDDSVMVTLVPRYGKGLVKIRGIKIEFAKD